MIKANKVQVRVHYYENYVNDSGIHFEANKAKADLIKSIWQENQTKRKFFSGKSANIQIN